MGEGEVTAGKTTVAKVTAVKATVVQPEPRFARVAAAIGDPTRARMLAYLLGNEYATAGEMARAAAVSAQTASSHLLRMLESDLLTVTVRGRHRYFRLAGDEVAHALEALSVVAERHALNQEQWNRPPQRALRQARTCYGHLAGRLGVALHDALLSRQCIVYEPDAWQLTDSGREWLASIGFDCDALPAHRRGVVFPCLDWSERRDHFAGPLATGLLRHFIARRWVRRLHESRAVELTTTGRRQFVGLL
jgi:DNA-binding transcriptional ArsR family regulator